MMQPPTDADPDHPALGILAQLIDANNRWHQGLLANLTAIEEVLIARGVCSRDELDKQIALTTSAMDQAWALATEELIATQNDGPLP